MFGLLSRLFRPGGWAVFHNCFVTTGMMEFGMGETGGIVRYEELLGRTVVVLRSD